jgi:putative hemolysin
MTDMTPNGDARRATELRLAVAATRREIMDAQHVRWRVYGEEERLLPASAEQGGLEIDSRDFDTHTTHLLVYRGDDPVGTVRLLRPRNFASPELAVRDLDLSAKFDVRGFSRGHARPAEVTRFCVLRQHRHSRVVALLFAGLLAESARHRITHWLAAANTQTDAPEDAAMLYRIARTRRLSSTHFTAEPRAAPPLGRNPERRIYTDAQLARAEHGDSGRLELPPILKLFARRMGARYLGPAAYDGYFNVFAMPLVAALDDLMPARAGTTFPDATTELSRTAVT